MSVEDTIRRLRAAGVEVTVGPPVRVPVTPPVAGESEEAFTARVIDLAHAHGWLAYHAIPLRTAKGYRTGTQGDKGFMDVVLARAGEGGPRLVTAELKVGRNTRDADQERWAAASGAALWYPRDWELIVDTLGG